MRQKRDRKLFVYLSEAEKQRLADLAGKNGDSISTTALRLIEAGLEKEIAA
jgi:hypothetical protein